MALLVIVDEQGRDRTRKLEGNHDDHDEHEDLLTSCPS
jgi:hypothetical protein